MWILVQSTRVVKENNFQNELIRILTPKHVTTIIVKQKIIQLIFMTFTC